jgi:hypothetical protein
MGTQMDKSYLKQVIAKLEKERAVHEEKFSDNPAHKDCQPRFDRVIENLKSDLGEEEPRLDFSVSQSALPDAIAPAKDIEAKAQKLEQIGSPAAQPLHEKARQIVFKELNELDGFDR